MYITLWQNFRGHPENISFMQFSQKMDGFRQKDSQGFQNSYNSINKTHQKNFTFSPFTKTIHGFNEQFYLIGKNQSPFYRELRHEGSEPWLQNGVQILSIQRTQVHITHEQKSCVIEEFLGSKMAFKSQVVATLFMQVLQ